jgi:DNA-binding MarR family transcriptional regulator
MLESKHLTRHLDRVLVADDGKISAMSQPGRQGCDHDCSPRDSIDALLESWTARRPDLDFGPLAVISRLARVRSHLDAEMEPVFERFGLGTADFEALVTLARISDPHGVSQRRLGDELGLTSGTVSVRIDRLATQGLAQRIPDPASGRSTLITLTAAGRELFERVAPAHLANEQRLLATLSAQERDLLASLLRKLLADFEGSRPAQPGGSRLGLVLAPAPTTISMRAAVGLSPAPGLLVRAVEPGTPAARAALQPGDVLTSAASRELRSVATLYAALRDADGHAIRLTLLRGNDELHADLDPGCTFPDGNPAVACEPGHPAEHIL